MKSLEIHLVNKELKDKVKKYFKVSFIFQQPYFEVAFGSHKTTSERKQILPNIFME